MAHDNDDEHAPPDAHGQAALLLVESLIHQLRDRDVLSTAEAVEILEIAIEAKRAIAADWGDTPAAREKSIALLDAIATSLRADL